MLGGYFASRSRTSRELLRALKSNAKNRRMQRLLRLALVSGRLKNTLPRMRDKTKLPPTVTLKKLMSP